MTSSPAPTFAVPAAPADRPLPGARSPRDPERHIPPGTHGLPPEQVVAIQRDRLLDAFVQVVGERGYAGAAIEHVCKAAGVSTKAFYRCFRDKDELFAATYDLGKEALLERATAAYGAAGPTWPDRVRAALASVLDMLAENPALARLCVVEVAGVGAAGHELVSTAIQEAFGVFGEVEAAVEPAVSLPVPVGEIVPLVIGGVFSRVYFGILAGRVGDLRGDLDTLTYFAILPFVGHDEAARVIAGLPSTDGRRPGGV
jgi:AcrR family transcriptional regulator